MTELTRFDPFREFTRLTPFSNDYNDLFRGLFLSHKIKGADHAIATAA